MDWESGELPQVLLGKQLPRAPGRWENRGRCSWHLHSFLIKVEGLKIMCLLLWFRLSGWWGRGEKSGSGCEYKGRVVGGSSGCEEAGGGWEEAGGCAQQVRTVLPWRPL